MTTERIGERAVVTRGVAGKRYRRAARGRAGDTAVSGAPPPTAAAFTYHRHRRCVFRAAVAAAVLVIHRLPR